MLLTRRPSSPISLKIRSLPRNMRNSGNRLKIQLKMTKKHWKCSRIVTLKWCSLVLDLWCHRYIGMCLLYIWDSGSRIMVVYCWMLVRELILRCCCTMAQRKQRNIWRIWELYSSHIFMLIITLDCCRWCVKEKKFLRKKELRESLCIWWSLIILLHG